MALRLKKLLNRPNCPFSMGVIHKVRTLGRGRSGPAISVLARMGGGWRGGSAVSVRTPVFSQVRYEKEIK